MIPGSAVLGYGVPPSSGGGGLTTGEHNALMALTLPAIADAVLSRGVAGVQATADKHSLAYVILAMSESNTTAHANYLTVFQTDGVTEFTRKAITASSGAPPVTGIS